MYAWLPSEGVDLQAGVGGEHRVVVMAQDAGAYRVGEAPGAREQVADGGMVSVERLVLYVGEPAPGGLVGRGQDARVSMGALPVCVALDA